MTITPGPPRIAPGACPGGVVIHVYVLPEPGGLPMLLVTRRIGPDEAARTADYGESDGLTADQLAKGRPMCLVAFDGDTGHRYSPEAWQYPDA